MKKIIALLATAAVCLSAMLASTYAWQISKDLADNYNRGGDLVAKIEEEFDRDENMPLEPGEYPKLVQARNLCDRPIFVRVMLFPEIVTVINGEEVILCVYPEDYDVISLDTVDQTRAPWIYGEDGYWYYGEELEAGALSTPVLDYVTISADILNHPIYEGAQLRIVVKLEAHEITTDYSHRIAWWSTHSDLNNLPSPLDTIDAILKLRADQLIAEGVIGRTLP